MVTFYAIEEFVEGNQPIQWMPDESELEVRIPFGFANRLSNLPCGTVLTKNTECRLSDDKRVRLVRWPHYNQIVSRNKGPERFGNTRSRALVQMNEDEFSTIADYHLVLLVAFPMTLLYQGWLQHVPRF